MSKMFGFSRRRMKLGRLKVHLNDPLHGSKSPARAAKQRLGPSYEEEAVTASVSGRSYDLHCQCSAGTVNLNSRFLEGMDNWTMLPTDGDKPSPRFNHAAAIIGGKMVVVGGDSGHQLLNDSKILSLDKLTWTSATQNIQSSASGYSPVFRACKGHCLVTFGRTIILVGGKTEAPCNRLSLWSFDAEMESWSFMEAKGDIPAARIGHTVIRAGLVLILFGGEDLKGRKLNDLHMFDLKSSTWLPLHYKGVGPCPRSSHAAALYDDRVLLVFGGQSKSKSLNDLYSLDFETMVWSRLKTNGVRPSPRAGCGSALCGRKWYIVGGGSKKSRHVETLVYDVLDSRWSICVTPPVSSIAAKKGFSLVTLHHKDKIVLITFGGSKKEPSNKVETLVIVEKDHSMSWRSAPDIDPLLCEDSPPDLKELVDHTESCAPSCSTDSIPRHGLSFATAAQHAPERRNSLSEPAARHPSSGSVSLRRQFGQDEGCSLAQKLQKPLAEEKLPGVDYCSPPIAPGQIMQNERRNRSEQVDSDGVSSNANERQPNDDDGRTVMACLQMPMKGSPPDCSEMLHLFETRIETLSSRVTELEEQLACALASKDDMERRLSLAVKSAEEAELHVADWEREAELLQEKMASLELALEEANSLSNAVHFDNVRLEHDVAFLKAVLDDTQKELQSTHDVLAGERARAFQLQVEVFHLKQRLQMTEHRSQTPRKTYNP